MEDVQDIALQAPDVGRSLTTAERALRDGFVREYLVDYDNYASCIRMGYSPAYAKHFCGVFMNDAYVLQQLKAKQTVIDGTEDSPESKKKAIEASLWREANYRGPGCSQAARVAALAKLAAIHGMDAPLRSKTEITGADGQPLNTGGVFVVPGIMTVEQWEAQAAAQQAALTTDNAEPVKH